MINQLDLLDKEGFFNIPIDEYLPGRECLSQGKTYADFCSTNYLGFDYSEELLERGNEYAKKWGTLTQWSRIEANCTIYSELEQKISEFLGTNKVLLAHSITSANYSHLPKIAKNGIIFADQFVHSVVWIACRLARDHGADLVKFKHQDLNHLESLLKENRNKSPKVIAIDGVYSISTEIAPIKELQKLCEMYDAWLYIDDAHGFGILGDNPDNINQYGKYGKGVIAHQNGDYNRTFYVSSFGKAFCTHTAFTTIPDSYTENLRAFSTQYIFSAPIAPSLIGYVHGSLDLNNKEGEHRREKIRELVSYFISGLNKINIEYLNRGFHPVIFVKIGAYNDLLSAAKIMFDTGILAGLRAYPLVPENECGFRFAITYSNSKKQIDKILNGLHDYKKSLNR